MRGSRAGLATVACTVRPTCNRLHALLIMCNHIQRVICSDASALALAWIDLTCRFFAVVDGALSRAAALLSCWCREMSAQLDVLLQEQQKMQESLAAKVRVMPGTWGEWWQQQQQSSFWSSGSNWSSGSSGCSSNSWSSGSTDSSQAALALAAVAVDGAVRRMTCVTYVIPHEQLWVHDCFWLAVVDSKVDVQCISQTGLVQCTHLQRVQGSFRGGCHRLSSITHTPPKLPHSAPVQHVCVCVCVTRWQ